MELTFNFELDDWMAFQEHFLKNSKQFKRSKVIATFMLPAMFTGTIVFKYINGEPISMFGVLFFAMLSILWVLLYPRGMEKRSLKRMKRLIKTGDNTGIICEHKIILSKENITHITSDSEQKLKWKAIKKIEENHDYYFLYDTSVSAIIIPKDKAIVDLNELEIILKKYM